MGVAGQSFNQLMVETAYSANLALGDEMNVVQIRYGLVGPNTTSAETCAGKNLLVPMGVRAEGPACADLGSETPIGTSGNWYRYWLSAS